MLSPVVAGLADSALVRLLFFDLSSDVVLLILGLAVLAPIATTMQERMMREFALVVSAELCDAVALCRSMIDAQTEEAGRPDSFGHPLSLSDAAGDKIWADVQLVFISGAQMALWLVNQSRSFGSVMVRLPGSLFSFLVQGHDRLCRKTGWQVGQ